MLFSICTMCLSFLFRIPDLLTLMSYKTYTLLLLINAIFLIKFRACTSFTMKSAASARVVDLMIRGERTGSTFVPTQAAIDADQLSPPLAASIAEKASVGRYPWAVTPRGCAHC